MDTGTSLLASRHKRNLLALMLEELPTLYKMQLHKPHVYDKDWKCCHCDLDSEDFNHLWLCPKSSIDFQILIPQAKILLQDTVNLLTTSGSSNLSSFLNNNPLWILPTSNQPHVHTFFSFIDLIKGIIPYCLTDALKQQGLSSSHVSLTIRTLLEYVQSSCWNLIWSPRCEKFKEFLQANNITPELQRSALPSGFLTSASPTRKLDRPTSESLLPTSMSLVNDFMNYGKVYPFPSGNNLVTWVLSIFW